LSESCKTGSDVRKVKILSERCKTGKTGSDVRQLYKHAVVTDLEVLPGMTTDDITDFRQDHTLLPPRLQVREEAL
jgi:hypothetical protein